MAESNGDVFKKSLNGLTAEEFETARALFAEEEKRRANIAPRPKHFGSVAWGSVYADVVSAVETSFGNGREMKDMSQYVYESVMVAVYGSGIFSALSKLGSRR